MAGTSWNLKTKRVETVLTAMGNRLGPLVVDEAKQWVAAALVGEHKDGFVLWEIARPEEEPFLLQTDETCETIAIHPKLLQVVFAAGDLVRIVDMGSKSEVAAIDTDDRVRGLKLSSDGRFLVTWGRKCAVWDFASRQKVCDLPMAGDGTKADVACEQILDVDDDGRVWAVALAIGSRQVTRSLVKFSSDGKSHDLIVGNLQMTGPVQPLTAVLSADRRLLAICDEISKPGEPETIQVWDVGGTMRQRVAGHEQHVGSMVFSPDGRKLASVSQAGGMVKIWQLRGK
jgi:WD40 repeat protein